MQELCIWMNGALVGTWSRGRTGHHRFEYHESWVTSPRARSLSLSMPIAANRVVEGAVVGNFFDNLLPDSESIRKRIRDRFRTKSLQAFELLQAIGRDCVGAAQLMPIGEIPVGFDRISQEPLNEADVGQILQSVTATPGLNLRERDDFRLSIAGTQEKTALLRIGKQWHRPKGATPTTHILKLPLGIVGGMRLDLTHSVENEWLCSQLLHALALPIAHTEIGHFADQKALVVERFDRSFMDGGTWIARLPQEDFCQVLGKPSDEKYEGLDGGPGMSDCLKVLAGSQASNADRQTFLCAQLAFWLLAATDGHAKNFSLFLLPGDQYRLTPLYDVLSAWPVIGRGPNHIAWKSVALAMAVRAKHAHFKLHEIQTRHWHDLAQKNGGAQLWQAMIELVDKAEGAIQKVEHSLPAAFPAQTADAIFSGIRNQERRFREGLLVRSKA